MYITSMSNNIIREVLSLHNKKFRDEKDLFIVEGKKQTEEIEHDWQICYFVATKEFENKIQNNGKIYYVSDSVFKKISTTVTPQGIMAIVKKKNFDIDKITNKQNGLFVILDCLQDPGNLGTIIRSSAAFGVDGIFISKNSIDVFSDKVVRSTTGAIFKVPIITECNILEIVKILKNKNITVYSLDLKAKKYISQIKFNMSAAIIIGNEAKGIEKSIIEKSDEKIKIKMTKNIESLNASVACSIALYEISKQKNL
ncbi:TrmH family RNA methyltransferase [Candidatus Ruminimicrobium bovinum]|uniref:TrmH family RNA methyltransferase n=1 Tax=Candidatus Ruminimicrobium bovinum TaxID=3242779 RepID=UPI0039B8D466